MGIGRTFVFFGYLKDCVRVGLKLIWILSLFEVVKFIIQNCQRVEVGGIFLSVIFGVVFCIKRYVLYCFLVQVQIFVNRNIYLVK